MIAKSTSTKTIHVIVIALLLSMLPLTAFLQSQSLQRRHKNPAKG
jgi:hypothetical protein